MKGPNSLGLIKGKDPPLLNLSRGRTHLSWAQPRGRA